jgi:hypothetical protein
MLPRRDLMRSPDGRPVPGVLYHPSRMIPRPFKYVLSTGDLLMSVPDLQIEGLTSLLAEQQRPPIPRPTTRPRQSDAIFQAI